MKKRRHTPEELWRKLDEQLDRIDALAGWQPNPDTERDVAKLKRFIHKHFKPI